MLITMLPKYEGLIPEKQLSDTSDDTVAEHEE